MKDLSAMKPSSAALITLLRRCTAKPTSAAIRAIHHFPISRTLSARTIKSPTRCAMAASFIDHWGQRKKGSHGMLFSSAVREKRRLIAGLGQEREEGCLRHSHSEECLTR